MIFYNRFVTPEDLAEFIGASDIYLTPYLHEAQITSGTLAYVFGAGKAVVSTPYWHARELLAEGRGVLVPFGNPNAIAQGVCEFLGDPERHEKTRREAYRIGRDMIWPAVAERYLESFQHARADRKAAPRTAFAGWTLASRPSALPTLRLDHMERMSDGTGIFQHAIFNVPDFHHGYCTYDNARLCHALILNDRLRPDPEAMDIGLKSLRWLASLQTTRAGHFRPIGSNGFYVRDGARADFDQQPVEAQAMVSACLEAFRVTQDPTWREEARRAFEWFLGRNDLGLPLYDANTGGCADGLHCDRVNENQGAESSLAFHLSLAEMNHAEHPLPTHS